MRHNATMAQRIARQEKRQERREARSQCARALADFYAEQKAQKAEQEAEWAEMNRLWYENLVGEYLRKKEAEWDEQGREFEYASNGSCVDFGGDPYGLSYYEQ